MSQHGRLYHSPFCLFAKNTKYRKIKNMWTQHIVDLSLINVGQIKYITKTDVKLPVIGM